jgi:tRNA (mo5U34)-methyltransferase
VSSPADASLRERVGALEWYHTLELAPGVVTPGWFDTRAVVDRLPFPTSLHGRRCLDVGTFDGFWAFEMKRRGASEVVAVDILDPQQWDWPAGSESAVVAAIGARKARGEGFEIAREALGHDVERRERSVYELDPARDGTFDFVYMGSLLLHLRDPVGALQRVRGVCTGELLAVDAIDLALTLTHPRRPTATLDAVGRPWWWKPNLAALARMVEAAGFTATAPPRRFFMPPGPGQPRNKLTRRAMLSRPGREVALRERWGDPHGVVPARAK